MRTSSALLLLASPATALLVAPAVRRARSINMLGGFDGPVVMGTEEIMSDKGKGHGTSPVPIQKDLRWNCDVEVMGRFIRSLVLETSRIENFGLRAIHSSRA